MTRGLINALEPHLPLRRSPLAIPNELKVLCALNFYAQGSYQKAVGVDCRLSIAQSTVSTFLQEVTCAINDHLLIKAMDTFSNDSTRDPTSCSEICDTDLYILNILARYPGSTHDSFVWRNSYVRHLLQMQHAHNNHCWLFGDSGYPLEPWLLTPFPEVQPVRYRTLEYAPEKAGQIINACAVLHNMCIRANIPLPPEPEEAIMAMEDDMNNGEIQPVPEGRAIFNEGQRMRNHLATRLAND
ncbi:PREDICTED: putative nuclease HARBI1 [Cyphomyrmex costatus]|uniref:putative nuclease HARBI1 n=1 Tax=Cyphomyrmex costatus TaxID=456900 RepID=UPI0008523CDE|nr:PREDICTED: putative nuclease HARBI1 [Cyphomyrmex costatus]